MQDNYLLLTMEGGTLYVRGNQFIDSPVTLGKVFPVRNFFLFCMFVFLSFTCLNCSTLGSPSEVSYWSVFCCTFQMEDWTEIQLAIFNSGDVRIYGGSNTNTNHAKKPAYSITSFKELYVGGAPRELRDKYVVINTAAHPPRPHLAVSFSGFNLLLQE